MMGEQGGPAIPWICHNATLEKRSRVSKDYQSIVRFVITNVLELHHHVKGGKRKKFTSCGGDVCFMYALAT